MNTRSEVRRLDNIVASNLKFLDTIRDTSVRGLFWKTMVEPYWLLADRLREQLED